MQITSEITTGAIGIMLTLIGMGAAGIATIIGIYIKSKMDIQQLSAGYTDLKVDVAEMKAEVKALVSAMTVSQVAQGKMMTQLELMQTMINLPDQMRMAVGKAVSAFKEEKH